MLMRPDSEYLPLDSWSILLCPCGSLLSATIFGSHEVASGSSILKTLVQQSHGAYFHPRQVSAKFLPVRDFRNGVQQTTRFVASNAWNAPRSLENPTHTHLCKCLSQRRLRSCTVLDRNHMHHRVDIKPILRPRPRTGLDLKDPMGSNDELRLTFDRDTKLAAGDRAIPGFGGHGLELELVAGLDRVDTE